MFVCLVKTKLLDYFLVQLLLIYFFILVAIQVQLVLGNAVNIYSAVSIFYFIFLHTAILTNSSETEMHKRNKEMFINMNFLCI